MMYSQNRAAQYTAVRSHGQVADATPARLVQIMFEHIVSNLATAQGCMQRINGNLPLSDVVAKGKAIAKATRLLGQLDATLDMERGGEIAVNLRKLYGYMLGRLTIAHADNDSQIIAEVSKLVQTIKRSWDQIVKEGQ